MSVQVTLTFATLEIAITALAALRATDAKVDVAPNAAAAPAPAPTKDKKAAASSPSAAAAPTAAPATPPAASAPPAPAAGDYAPVGAVIAKKVAEGHKVLAVALLAKFGAKSGKELKPEQYADFMKELAEVGLEPDIS